LEPLHALKRRRYLQALLECGSMNSAREPSPMVEQVAQAICDELDSQPIAFDEFSPALNATDVAKAALKASHHEDLVEYVKGSADAGCATAQSLIANLETGCPRVTAANIVSEMIVQLANWDYLLPNDFIPDPPLRKRWFRWRPAFEITQDMIVWAGEIARARSLMDLKQAVELIGGDA
jgi:hypothetical protein